MRFRLHILRLSNRGLFGVPHVNKEKGETVFLACNVCVTQKVQKNSWKLFFRLTSTGFLIESPDNKSNDPGRAVAS